MTNKKVFFPKKQNWHVTIRDFKKQKIWFSALDYTVYTIFPHIVSVEFGNYNKFKYRIALTRVTIQKIRFFVF